MVASLTHDVFTGLVNKKFRVQLDENKTGEMELIEVSDLETSPYCQSTEIKVLEPF